MADDEIRLRQLALLQQQAEKKRSETEDHDKLEQHQAIKVNSNTMINEKVLSNKHASSQASDSQATVQPPRNASAVSFEEWQDKVLSRVFQVSLDPKADNKDPKCVHIEGLIDEFKSINGQPNALNQKLDMVIMERCTLDQSQLREEIRNQSTLDYLYSCWKETTRIHRNMSKSDKLDASVRKQRLDALDVIREVVVKFTGSNMATPDMFGDINGDELEKFIQSLLADQDSMEFLSTLATKSKDDNLHEILDTISQRALEHSILESQNVERLFQVFTALCKDKATTIAMTKFSEFNPKDATAFDIEKRSLLGRFLRLSAYPDSEHDVAKRAFHNIENQNTAALSSCTSGLRGQVTHLQTNVFQLADHIVHSEESARESLLSYFADILRLNAKRAQTQVDPTKVASDGFMHNTSTVLLQLCQPFLTMDGSSVNKINTNYLKTSKRLDFKEDTKINATEEQANEYYGAAASTEKHKFITEIFFITMTFLHQGPIRAFVAYKEFLREYTEYKKMLDKLNESPPPPNTPQGFELNRLKAKIEEMTAQKHAYESMLLEPEYLSSMLRFYNFVMSWIIKIVQPSRTNRYVDVELPLPKEVPESFAMLPEWIIDDVAEFYLFVGRYGFETHVIKNELPKEVVIFIITFLSSRNYMKDPQQRDGTYIKNPYLMAKFVEVLFQYTYPIIEGVPGELTGTLVSLPFALNFTVPSLVGFYVEVEQTGASTQFYDKFNIRYHIGHILKIIWMNHPDHSKSFWSMGLGINGKESQELVIHFINYLMSDATYLLDQGLDKLAEIYQIQNEMEDKTRWDALPPNDRRQREGTLQSAERIAQSDIALSNEAIYMMKYLTEKVPEPFLVEEIVSRLAALLNSFLGKLVGTKCSELKVKNSKKYHFEPRKLLGRMIDIYLNLAGDKLAEAIAKDDRSYKKEHFLKASGIMKKYGLKTSDDLKKLGTLLDDADKAIERRVEEEDLGEPPEEFLDPIFCSLMEDPVLLPTSNLIVDRSTIRTHLLQDPRDPFNRAPLTMKMVQPDTQLKNKIEEWKRTQRAKLKNDKMDISL